MAANETAVWQGMVIWAAAKAREKALTPLQIIDALIVALNQDDITTGKVMVGFSEAGANSNFQLPPGIDPASAVTLAMRARDYVIDNGNDQILSGDPTSDEHPLRFKPMCRVKFDFSGLRL